MSNARRMQVGDPVEFLSDQQTKAGPSKGSIIEVEKDAEHDISISVKHGNVEKEVFQLDTLRLVRNEVRDDNTVLWVIA